MRRLLIILASILVLSSCSPEFYCKHCPTTTVIKDSVVFERDTVWRDSLVTIPSDTVTITDSIDCPDYEKEIVGLRSHIKILIKDKKLTATCTCDSIELQLRMALIRERMTKYHTELRTIEKTVPKKATWWNKTLQACGYTFLSLLLLALIYGTYRLLKFLKIIR